MATSHARRNDARAAGHLPLKLAAGGSMMIMVALSFIKLTDQLRFEATQIPSLVQRGTNFWLGCQFRLQPDQQLYSVKWYKNNEEFYRLLQPSSSSSSTSGAQVSTGGGGGGGGGGELLGWPQTVEPATNQQQYFSQSGVNVLMSSSNATHVRLLNASLESEGLYACEISTQNLSSIRYEREIRVYVLPHSRLSVIGFKSRYALGDQLHLACNSDYSRPRPALAWFINNQLIKDQQQTWFSLESQNRSKLNEPTLFRQTLSLKFKLSPELLHWLWQLPQTTTSHQLQSGRHNQGNQSLGGAFGPPPYQQLRPVLRLQCKYKLTEVTDLTFNELTARQKSPAPISSELATIITGRDKLPARRANVVSVTDAADAAGGVSVSKLTDNRLSQSKCPAKRNELRAGLLPGGRARLRSDECRMGQLALQPDDPVILEGEPDVAEPVSSLRELPNPDQQPDEGEDEEQDGESRASSGPESGARPRRQVIGAGLELSIGDVVSVNCSTISALLADEPMGSGASAVVSAVGGPTTICYDSEARRRSVISGKYQTQPEQDAATPNQRAQQSSWVKPHGRRDRDQQPPSSGPKLVSQLLLSQRQLELLDSTGQQGHEARASASPSPKADESTLQRGATTFETDRPRDSIGIGIGNQLEAPPLLEWFINNQEVGAQPSEGDTSRGAGATPEELPIDYVSYFANFDARPSQQQLPLRLELTKRHFMTPDSNLRLRCSSTQAQVLLVESVSLSLLPSLVQPPDGAAAAAVASGQRVWQQKPSPTKLRIHDKHLKPSNLAGLKPADNSGGSKLGANHPIIVLLLVLLSVATSCMMNKSTVIV